LLPLADSAKELAVPIVPVQLNENKILDTAPNDPEFFSVTLLADMVNLPLTTPKSQLQRSMFKYVAVLDLLDLQHSKQELHSKQEMLPATEQQLRPSVHVPEFHHSRDSPLLLSPFLPEISVARPVLHIDVSPQIGPLSSIPVAPVTCAQVLISKISATAPFLAPKIIVHSPQVNCLSPPRAAPDPKAVSKPEPLVLNPLNQDLELRPSIICTALLAPGVNILDPGYRASRHCGYVKMFNASDHVESSWSTILATRRRRPHRSTCAHRLPETIPPRTRPPNAQVPLTL